MSSEISQAKSNTAMKQTATAAKSADAVSYCGHHYFNPQWVFQGANTPALMYNDAVYFTVSADGTYYFHQAFKGQFYPTISAVEEHKSKQLKAMQCPQSSRLNQHSDSNSTSLSRTSHQQVSVIPWFRHRKGYQHKILQEEQQPRPRRDVRSTVIPMFPGDFSLERQESHYNELLTSFFTIKRTGMNSAGKRPRQAKLQ